MEGVRHFGVWDYVVFAGMLVLSVSIGVYSALSGGRQRTAEEFFLGDRKMNIVPVAMSVVVSFVSAVSVIGTPGEMYMYNTVFAWALVTYAISNVVVCRLFIPVLFRLRITSVYEFLELRFSRAVKLCCTLAFCVQTILYMGIVMYTPALAINAVTGMDLWMSVMSTGLICIFYTSVGGIKAVLWTDTLQAFILVIGVLAVVIKGSVEVGGFGNVLRIGVDGKRIKLFEMDPDPRIRYSFWSLMLGFTVLQTSLGLNQTVAQRLISTGSSRRAAQAMFLASIFLFIMLGLCIFSGVVMYAYYVDCDPYTSGEVGSKDQLMPLFVMELFADMPGLPGLFLSAAAAASISTLSSGVNSLAAITGEEGIKVIWPDMSPAKYARLMKVIAMAYGFISLAFAFVSSKLGYGVLALCLSLMGIIGGGTLALFFLGIFVHRCNSKGALSGFLVSVIFTGWLRIGSILHPQSQGSNSLSIDGCPVYNTTTIANSTIAFSTEAVNATTNSLSVVSATLLPSMWASSSIQPTSVSQLSIVDVYNISYLYYSLIGLVICLVVAWMVSALTGFNDPNSIDPRLKYNLTDALCCCFPQSIKRRMRCEVDRIETDYNEVADDDGKDMDYVFKNGKAKNAGKAERKGMLAMEPNHGEHDVNHFKCTQV